MIRWCILRCCPQWYIRTHIMFCCRHSIRNIRILRAVKRSLPVTLYPIHTPLDKKIQRLMRQSFLQLSDVLFFYPFIKSPKKNTVVVLLVTLECTIHTSNIYCTTKLYTYRFRHIILREQTAGYLSYMTCPIPFHRPETYIDHPFSFCHLILSIMR